MCWEAWRGSPCRRAADTPCRDRHDQRSRPKSWGSECTVAPPPPGADGNLFVWSPAAHSSASCLTERGEHRVTLRKVSAIWAWVQVVLPKSSPYPLLLSLPQFLVFLQHLQDRLSFVFQQKGEVQILPVLLHWSLSLHSTGEFSQAKMLHGGKS